MSRHLSATRWTVVQAARAGDDAAIRDLVLKYRPAVLNYLRRRGLGEEAEDVAQETLFSLVSRALSKADPGSGRFRALVFAIARNLLAKHHERRTAQKRGGGKVQLLGEIEVAEVGEPDEDFDREWLAQLVQKALSRLSVEHPNYFEAMRRFMLEGQPQAQIAAELGVSAGVVKKHVFRGKKKLVGYLKSEVWAYACSAKEYEVELRYLGSLLGFDKELLDASSHPE